MKMKVRKSKLITLESVLKDTCWTEEQIKEFSDKPLTVIELINHPKMSYECLHQIRRHCDKKIIREWNKRVVTKVTNEEDIINAVKNAEKINTTPPDELIELYKNITVETIFDEKRESIVIPEIIRYEITKKIYRKKKNLQFLEIIMLKADKIEKATEKLTKPYYKILRDLLIEAEETGEITISS